MSLKPIADRVLIKPKEAEETTVSGIVLPASASLDGGLVTGTVVATGPGLYMRGEKTPMTVQKGDKVLYPRYGFLEVEHDGESYHMIRETEIAAVVD